MKNLRRYTALLFAVLLLLGFPACAGTAPDVTEEEELSAVTAPPPDEDFVYVAEYKEIETPETLKHVDGMIRRNDQIYMIAYLITGQKTVYYGSDGLPVTDPEMIETGDYASVYTSDVTEQCLCTMDIDGGDFQVFPGYKPTALPEGVAGSVSVAGMEVCKNGDILILEAVSVYSDDRRGVGEVTLYLLRYDEAGNELERIDLTGLSGEGEPFYVSRFALDGDDTVYLTDIKQTLYVLKADGTLDFSIQNQKRNQISALIRFGDGRIGCIYSGREIAIVDKAAKGFGERLACPSAAAELLPGNGAYDLYYLDTSSFHGYRIAGQESYPLIDWIANDVNAETLQCVLPLEDGRIIAVTQNLIRGINKLELISFTKADPAAIPEKTVLDLAGFYIDSDIRSQIIEFNKRSSTTRINVTDYSIYNTPEAPYLGQTKLSLDLISGQIPDIVATDQLMNFRKYANRGYFEDLSPYLDNDPELGPEAMLRGARKALSIDGKLYQIASQFSISTVGGPASIVGDEMGWTIGDLEAALAKMPEGCRPFDWMTRGDLLNHMLMLKVNAYIDWTTGVCDFQNEEFIRFLEFIKTFPAEIDPVVWDDERPEQRKIMDGDVLLAPLSLYNFRDYKIVDQIFSGGVTFVGYPIGEGIGSAADFRNGLAISSACRDKDAAWSFIRFLLTKDYQMRTEENYEEYGGYPTNREVFDLVLGYAAMGKDHIKYWSVDPETQIKLDPLTEEQTTKLCDLIDDLDGAFTFDEDILKIVAETAAPFFEDQKAASEVVDIIQSRVSIYINEQK